MPAYRIFPFIALLTACGVEPSLPGHDQGWQSFSLGTMPFQSARDSERRYIVSVPRRYIDKNWLPDPLFTDQHGRIIANAIRFGVKYPSMEPAEDAWADGAMRIVIGNIIEDSISRSVDGSWNNYYSGFSINLPDEFGLHVRKRADRDPLDRRIYFRISAQDHIRIECTTNLREHKKWCVMIAKRPGEPYVETGFYSAGLSRWHERLNALRTLFRSEGKQPLGWVSKS